MSNPTSNNDSLHNRFTTLLNALDEKGFNHTDVAERIGVDKSTISIYYSDKRKNENSSKKYRAYIEKIEKEFVKELGQLSESENEYDSLRRFLEKKIEELLDEVQDLKAGQSRLEKQLKTTLLSNHRRRRG